MIQAQGNRRKERDTKTNTREKKLGNRHLPVCNKKQNSEKQGSAQPDKAIQTRTTQPAATRPGTTVPKKTGSLGSWETPGAPPKRQLGSPVRPPKGTPGESGRPPKGQLDNICSPGWSPGCSQGGAQKGAQGNQGGIPFRRAGGCFSNGFGKTCGKVFFRSWPKRRDLE